MSIDEGYVLTDGYALMQTAGSTLVGSLVIGLFAIHVNKSINFVKSQTKPAKSSGFRGSDESERIRKLSHLFTLTTLMLYAIHAIFLALDTYGTWAEVSCDFSKRGSAFLYHCSKVALYCTLATRLMVGFSESSYARPIRIAAYTVYILSVVFFFIALYFDVIEGVLYGSKVISQPSLHLQWCQLSKIPLWGVLLTLSFDMTLTTICLFAFMYPLRQLVLTTQRIEDSILLLLQRYTLLTFVALFTSAFSLLIINYFHLSWMLLFDNLLNGLCIVMMSSFYNAWYNKLCCCKSWKYCMCGIVLTRKLTMTHLNLGSAGSKDKSKSEKSQSGSSRKLTVTSQTATNTMTNTASGASVQSAPSASVGGSNKKQSKKASKNEAKLMFYNETLDVSADNNKMNVEDKSPTIEFHHTPTIHMMEANSSSPVPDASPEPDPEPIPSKMDEN